MGRTGWSGQGQQEICILCLPGWHECRKRLKIRPAQNTSDRLGRPFTFRYSTHDRLGDAPKILRIETTHPWKALRKSINGLVNKVNVPWLPDVCSTRNDPKIFWTASCLLNPRWETSKTSWRSHTWHRSYPETAIGKGVKYRLVVDNSLKANHRWCQLKVDLHFYKSHHLPFHTLWYILQHCMTFVPLLREMQTEQLTGALPRKPCARSWSSGPFRAKWLPSFTPDSTTFCHGKAPIFNPMLVDRSQVHWSVPKWLLRVLPMFLGCQMIKCVDWELNSRESYEVGKKFWLILSDVHSHRKQMELN